MKYLFSFCSWSNLWIKTNLLTKGIKFFIKNETYRIIKVLTFPKYAYVRNWPYGWIGPCKNFFFLENSCTHMGLSYMPVWRCLVTGKNWRPPFKKVSVLKINRACQLGLYRVPNWRFRSGSGPRNAGSDPVPVFWCQFRFRVPSGYFRVWIPPKNLTKYNPL